MTELTLRRANMNDAELLLSWRNDPLTREMSFRHSEIHMIEHSAWLQKVMLDGTIMLMIAEENGVPVGTVRTDYVDGETRLSWTVAPEVRGRGIGKQMVKMAADAVVGDICAIIFHKNKASIKIVDHVGMGYVGGAGFLHFKKKKEWR